MGDLGSRKIQLPPYRLYLEHNHAILQRATSFCGPCELVEISEGEGLSAGPLHCSSTEPVNVPSIEASKTVVKELESVSLTCSSNDPGISFRWLFKGEHLVLTDRMKLSDNNRILTIDPVKLEDSGEYKCEVSNPANFKDSDAIVLDIIREYPSLSLLLHSVGVGQFLYQQNG